MSDVLHTHAAALRYLRRDPHANRELVLALRYEPVAEARIVARDGVVVGALVRGPGPSGTLDEWLRIDADDAAAVHELVGETPLTPQLIVSIHRRWIAAIVQREYGLAPNGDGIYGYLVDQTRLRVRSEPAVRRLEPDDARLVERSGCGWSKTYFARLFEERRRPWAVIKDGAIVCRASSGYPDVDSEEVIGVWTHPGWRGRGLAQALVGAVAADILARARYAAYTTTFLNPASQAVACAVGFDVAYAAVSLQLRSDTDPGLSTPS